MSDNIARLVEQYDLSLCVECGKCVAVCPMGEIFDDFSYQVSPRGVIEWAQLAAEIPEDSRLWFCLTCDLCTDRCPAGVCFRDFVEAIRQLAVSNGITKHGVFCQDCGAYLWPQHTVEYLGRVLGEPLEYLTRCPRCRQYEHGEKMRGSVRGQTDA